jgi:hypothetical protein
MPILSDPAEATDGPERLSAREAVAGLDVPSRADELASHYDLTISRPTPESPQFAAFDRWLAQAASEHGISCALIHDGIVEEVVHRLAGGKLSIGYHLDYFALWHRPADLYARLARAVEDTGGESVNAPARARAFTDKATAVNELRRRGLGVPATLIVRPRAPHRPLTTVERRRLGIDALGQNVYLKPANGFAGDGVVRTAADDESLTAALVAARHRDPDETVLIQCEISTPSMKCDDGVARPAYWRVLYQAGTVMPFWWQPQSRIGPAPSYRAVTNSELRRLRLDGVIHYVIELAGITGLNWFSTELCLGGAQSSRYSVTCADGRERPILAIDPVNDQCDVDVQSRWPGAPPDDVVRRIAERFAERAWQLRQQTLRPHSAACYRFVA